MKIWKKNQKWEITNLWSKKVYPNLNSQKMFGLRKIMNLLNRNWYWYCMDMNNDEHWTERKWKYTQNKPGLLACMGFEFTFLFKFNGKNFKIWTFELNGLNSIWRCALQIFFLLFSLFISSCTKGKKWTKLNYCFLSYFQGMNGRPHQNLLFKLERAIFGYYSLHHRKKMEKIIK